MAGLIAVLAALARLEWRHIARAGTLIGNSFPVLAIVLQMGQSAGFVLLLFVLLLILPVCTDPLRRIPQHRLALWPLGRRQVNGLRFVAVWLNPMSWITVSLVLMTSWSLGLLFLALALTVNLFSLPSFGQWNPFRYMPAPAGRFQELLRKDLRNTFHLLDTYLAIALSIATATYRFVASKPEPEAWFVMSLLVVLALSTAAQTLFAPDGPAGVTRYRMLPVRGWQVLLTKDAALLLVTLVLTLPLTPLPAVGAMLAALAVGHRHAIEPAAQQPRWSFAHGSLVPDGLVQAFGIFSMGVTIHRQDWRWIGLSVLLWAGSVLYYGRRFDKA
ncbi:MAG: hypothetical protein FJW20_17720 [Acidimicrobiia bacterium]|nr:hypothetical protein [Acidimicrobiia bacterium]